MDEGVLRFERPIDRQRRSRLEPVERLLRQSEADLDIRYELVDVRRDRWVCPREDVLGLVVDAAEAEGLATVVPARFRAPSLGTFHLATVTSLNYVMGGAVDYSLQRDGWPLGYDIAVEERARSDEKHPTILLSLQTEFPDDAAAAVLKWAEYRTRRSVPPPGPVGKAHIKQLRALASAKLASPGMNRLRFDFDDRALAALTTAGRRSLDADLQSVSPDRLLWNFPRDARGRLAVKTSVLLVAYEAENPPSRGREFFLIASGPTRRNAPEEILLRPEWVFRENWPHRWDHDRWLWDRGWSATLAQRWHLEDDGTVAACSSLLDEGKIPEALALHDVTIDERLTLLVQGTPINYRDSDMTQVWAPRVQEGLRHVAPWLLRHALEMDRAERRAQGRKNPARSVRLFGLGGVQQQRQPGVFLSDRDGRPHLAMEFSAGNARLPEEWWARPVDYELMRRGLIGTGDIPG